ncbi:MAG: hypothetical protein IPM35_23205 [Myxococcales bacterium]|nr:hypothetical protein [Myxococcales bacterium]
MAQVRGVTLPFVAIRLAFGLPVALLACQQPAQRETTPPAVAVAAAPATAPTAGASEQRDATAPTASVDWSTLVGRCVVAEGYVTGGTKSGPKLLGGRWSIPLVPAGTQALPTGARVRARGVVAERSNRAVFIQEPGEPAQQGIPVPPGTDLEAARRQRVLEHAVVAALRSLADVESALTASVGKTVSLPGVVWSKNGHYWFNHDGVDVHVEGTEKLPGWSALHGKVVTLNGELSRRPMPRIDQVALKAKRDLADAFVLLVREVADDVGSTVVPCAE